MNQDSFRKLIAENPNKLAYSGSQPKRKTISASTPAFQPRKVKKADPKYRDRAAERRGGTGNDYAQIEAVLEDFEKTTDSEFKEKKRQLLGGDSEHSILVKGLDVALLEQNKARAALATDDDDSLEQAFQEGKKEVPPVPQKRRREDIIRELKEQRSKPSGPTESERPRAMEDATKTSKFKPIGFKPVGGEKEKKKQIKHDRNGEKKKKKKKEKEPTEVGQQAEVTSAGPSLVPEEKANASLPAEEALEEDVDIFGDVGEYEGLDTGDDEDDEDAMNVERHRPTAYSPSTDVPEPSGTSGRKKRWFLEDDEPGSSHSAPPPLPSPLASTSTSAPPPVSSSLEDEETYEDAPMRLVPLSSSALPSIKEFLAMDKAAENEDKKRKRKEKNKNKKDGEGSKLTAEGRAERDYKRLKTYTEKKGAS